ncbi:hypothetical protein [Kineosporia babensis]|uniref:Secreted protein n=1 Tax=Kineosporia babensis TaxID=499548 RepID=A0A9X1NMT6_9ACTN|nr:hypothetical protein [Kineosporia babensis]MCD5316414.1 hypothetical protein [Kineosporia babensis]
MRPPRVDLPTTVSAHARVLALSAFLLSAFLLSACSGGDSEATPRPSSDSTSSEESKGAACEKYRALSAQVETASAAANAVTVSSEEDGQKVTELMTKVSELTEQADAAYALCYAEGAQPQNSP